MCSAPRNTLHGVMRATSPVYVKEMRQSWRVFSPGLARKRILFCLIAGGLCLCVLPWFLDWARREYDYDFSKIAKLPWYNLVRSSNRKNFTARVGDIWSSGRHRSRVSKVGLQSNLTRIHTIKEGKKIDADQFSSEKATRIIIGLGITSAGVKGFVPGNLRSNFAFFRHLLPTFCKTASGGYHYGFYLGYDYNDTFFSHEQNRITFENIFQEVTGQICAEDLSLRLHLIRCAHAKRPAWAQNDAMMEGYLDGGEYFYRVNDDTEMETPGWLQDYLNTLQHHTPSNVGVVGPRHIGGNRALLTYDFVHRTHIDIFGFYYPRIFTDWFADDWITKVYEPGRITKVNKVWLKHTLEYGQRYTGSPNLGAKLDGQIAADKDTIKRYIKVRESRPLPGSARYDQKEKDKVIAMSLYSSNATYTFGALRNAQLVPLLYPDWTLRVYVCNQCDSSFTIPKRILHNLEVLGAHIMHVTEDQGKGIHPRMWSFLVADDLGVDVFLVRDPTHRLNERDWSATRQWLRTDAPVSCIRDHPAHGNMAVVRELWGGRPAVMRKVLQKSLESFLVNSGNVMSTLTKMWEHLSSHSICYDSITCQKWPNTVAFPASPGTENLYVGQPFDQFHNPVNPNEIPDHLRKMVNCTVTYH